MWTIKGSNSYVNFLKCDLKTKYIIEFTDSKKVYEMTCSGKWSIDDTYTKRKYSDVAEAFELYYLLMLNPEIVDVKFYEEIYLDGEVVRESWLEPSSTCYDALCSMVDKDLRTENLALRKNIKAVENLIGLYKDFIETYADGYLKEPLKDYLINGKRKTDE